MNEQAVVDTETRKHAGKRSGVNFAAAEAALEIDLDAGIEHARHFPSASSYTRSSAAIITSILNLASTRFLADLPREARPSGSSARSRIALASSAALPAGTLIPYSFSPRVWETPPTSLIT